FCCLCHLAASTGLSTLSLHDALPISSLAVLLRALAARVPQARWLRLLYAYPASVTEELLEVMATEPAVCHYLDMPLQHISDRMRSEEHTSELQSPCNLVCRLLLEKKK